MPTSARNLRDRKKERGFIRHRTSSSRPFGRGRGGSRKGGRLRGGDRGAKGTRSPNKVDNKMVRGSAQDLQARVRCFNCNELGHYAKDCPLKGAGKGSVPNAKRAHFVVCHGTPSHTQVFAASTTPSTSATSSSSTARSSSSVNLADRLSIFAGVRVQGGQALVDTAAEDAVVGTKALQLLSVELATFGLRYVPVSLQQAIPCAGIGGSATVTQLVDMPTCVAGILGRSLFGG